MYFGVKKVARGAVEAFSANRCPEIKTMNRSLHAVIKEDGVTKTFSNLDREKTTPIIYEITGRL